MSELSAREDAREVSRFVVLTREGVRVETYQGREEADRAAGERDERHPDDAPHSVEERRVLTDGGLEFDWVPRQNVDEGPTCPRDGESYYVNQRTPSRPSRPTDQHPVTTDTEVILRDGQPALRLQVECRCGWSATTVLYSADTGGSP